jgi:ADP-ribose pyrophosphatase
MARLVVYTGRKFRVEADTTPGPDGQPIRRDVVVHPGAVAILPLLDDGRVCLLRNERPAAGERLLEIPAGTREAGETPEQTAVRELAEETGYQAGEWRQLAEFYPSPGVLSEKMYLFVARRLGPGPSHLERDEQLEPQIVSWADAVRWACDGTIRDAKTLVAILLWDRLRQG